MDTVVGKAQVDDDLVKFAGTCLNFLKRSTDILSEHFLPPHNIDLDLIPEQELRHTGHLLESLHAERHEPINFLLGPVKILNGEAEERHHADTQLFAEEQAFLQRPHPLDMALLGCGESVLFCMPTVAVHDEADVSGDLPRAHNIAHGFFEAV